MTELCAFYSKLLEEEGLECSVTYRGQKLKHRLQQRFGESLVFFRNVKRMADPVMVTAAEVPRDVLFAGAAANLSTSVDQPHPVSDDSQPEDAFEQANSISTLADIAGPSAALDDITRVELVHSALYLRGLILSMKSSLPSTPTADDL